jgi:hypothetical protein
LFSGFELGQGGLEGRPFQIALRALEVLLQSVDLLVDLD